MEEKMMNITLTKERLVEIAGITPPMNAGMIVHESEVQQMARMLLAGMPANSMPSDERAAFEAFYLEMWKRDAVWAKEKTLDDVVALRGKSGDYADWGFTRGAWAGWQGRAAMLQGKADPRENVRREHAEWSQSTFGSVGPVGPLKHLSKEALEAAAEPDDLSEWADMQFLLWDGQRRAGITDEQITQAMLEKLAVNKARTWPEPKDGEPRLHIKAAPQQEVK